MKELNHDKLAKRIKINLKKYDGDFEESMDGLKFGSLEFSCSGIAYELAEAYLDLYEKQTTTNNN